MKELDAIKQQDTSIFISSIYLHSHDFYGSPQKTLFYILIEKYGTLNNVHGTENLLSTVYENQ